MAVDKSLMQAPPGLSGLMPEEDPLEVLLGDAVEDDGEGGVIITFGKEPAGEGTHDENLAERLSDEELSSLASTLMQDVQEDENSRREWTQTYVKGLELLALKHDERMEPWPGACGVNHPLLMESAVKFQSETMMETFPAQGPVRAKIIGRETQEKKDAAMRVEQDMNFRLTETLKEYRPEHERLLLALCLSGNAFKKIYFDPAQGRETAIFVPAEDVIVPYGASSLDNAERVTHRMRRTKNELKRLQVTGFYRDVEISEPTGLVDDEVEKAKAKEQGYTAYVDKRHQIYEIQCYLNLKGYEDKDSEGVETGIELPYIVSIEKSSNTVLSVRRNWIEGDENKVKRQHFVHYGYVPGFGFYYFGLIHLIGGHTKTATSLTRQLIDAGTLANLSGGFKAKGMRVKGDSMTVAPGEWLDVDLPSGTIRDNILPLPYKEPSATLVTLLDKVVDDGRRFASTADLKVSDMSSQAPVGTTLAVLERMLKVMSAVQARVHFAMKQEFKLLKAIISENAPDEYEYDPEVGERFAKRDDYTMVEVIPVADPNAATMSQRVVQYQAVQQLSKDAPQLYDLQFLHRQMIEMLGVKNANKIVPSTEDLKPIDPVSENMAILTGKPVKAFMHQDHEAHLQVHLTAIQDPKLAQIIQQNPQAPAIQAAAMAHVMEHVAFQYRRDIEKMLGAALPPVPEQASGEEEAEHILPPQIEVQLSQLAAQAAGKLLQKDIAEAQMMEQQAMANDPVMQLQQRDIAVKEAEQQRKQAKDIIDAAAKADQLAAREREVQGNQQLQALKIVTDAAAKGDQIDQTQQMESQRIAADLHKHGTQLEQGQRQHDQRTALDAVKHSGEREDRQREFNTKRQDDNSKYVADKKTENLKYTADRADRQSESERRHGLEQEKLKTAAKKQPAKKPPAKKE